MQLRQKLTRVFSRVDRRVIYTGVLVVIAVALFFMLGGLVPSLKAEAALYKLENGLVNFDSAKTFWDGEISRKGSRAASEELLELATAMDNELNAHLFAHAFGKALFDKEGEGGFLFCPYNFNQGCPHQFIGEAIAHEGFGVVDRLFLSCKVAGSEPACMHSVGHGIMGYVGYTFESLERALDECSSYNPSPRGGCMVGSMMEYNLRFLTGTGKDGVFHSRPYDKARPYDPCLSLSVRYQDSCAFALPTWWSNVAMGNLPIERRFSELNALCDGMSSRLERPCFEGLGVMAAYLSNGDIPDSVALCKAPGSSLLQQLFCTTGIVLHLHFWQVPGYADVCEYASLTESFLQYCQNYAAADVEHFDAVPLPQ